MPLHSSLSIFRPLEREDSRPEAVLAAVFPKGEGARSAEASLEELSRLLETAGGRTFARVVQSKDAPDRATYLGSGKLEEMRRTCELGGVSLAVFDAELSPTVIRNIERALGQVRVIDRTMLILDIFALHARSREGMLQVELAQLKYTAPRLAGRGKDLSRLGGGIGTRGPGESKLETDRRHLSRREAALTAELETLTRQRATRRRARERAGVFSVAIAGYTNAGKTTLCNALTGAGLLAEDKLFATLDPATRRYRLPSGREILLTDTVGFIRNLPTRLIDAFRSTLEEVSLADAVLLLLDASDEECEAQLAVTRELLAELGAGDKPTVIALNKCDLRGAMLLPRAPGAREAIVCISAKTGQGLPELIEVLERLSREDRREAALFFPSEKLGLLNDLFEAGSVLEVRYEPSGARVRASLDAPSRGRLREYLVE